MQVTIETIKNLERKITVQLPSGRFDDAYHNRLTSLTKTVKLPGFRAGKVPLKVVRQHYGASVQNEILDDLIRNAYGDAVKQENLKPAGLPHIQPKPHKVGQDVEFEATFEVFPEITLAELSSLKVVKPIAEVDDNNTKDMLLKLRKQKASWEKVERAAKVGDQVKIDFSGTVNGEPFEGGSSEDFVLELGSKQMIDGFEDQIVGIKPSENKSIKVKFPKDYAEESLQGKKAVFSIDCKEVLEQILPDLDEAFVKEFGIEDGKVSSLEKQLKDHLQHELSENLNIYTKREVMDSLLAAHPTELPNVMVDQEIQQLQQQMYQNLGLQEGSADQLPRELFEEKAKRRVGLSLLLGEIIQNKGLEVDADSLQQKVRSAVANYQDPEQVMQYYMNNKELLKSFEILVLEDQIVDIVLAEAKVSEKKLSFDELVEANRKAA